MLSEFQVFFTRGEGAAIETLVVRERDEGKARALVSRMGVRVLEVGPGRVVLDWNQDVFNREEAGAFLRGKASKVDEAMAKGELPRARGGWPLFTRRQLLEFVEAHQAPAGVERRAA